MAVKFEFVLALAAAAGFVYMNLGRAEKPETGAKPRASFGGGGGGGSAPGLSPAAVVENVKSPVDDLDTEAAIVGGKAPTPAVFPATGVEFKPTETLSVLYDKLRSVPNPRLNARAP